MGGSATATPTDEPAFIAKGAAAPAIVGTTLDGQPFDLTALRGRPVVVNFWGPSCVPCRDEFPLLKAKLAKYGGNGSSAGTSGGIAIVGILMDDPVAPAQDFIAQYAATWPTVNDPDKSIRTAYRVAARPQTYFIDRDGILRSIQVGELTDEEFEKQYALISGGAAAPSGTPVPLPAAATPSEAAMP